MPDTSADLDLASGISAFESKHFAMAQRLLSPFLAQGHPEALFRMAIMAQNGLGMVRNEANAFTWMRAAAEQGHGLAQHGLGFMYMQGECVTQDGAEAVQWFKRAAAQGLAGSQTTLGMMYEQGMGVPKDMEEAQRWYKLAGF